MKKEQSFDLNDLSIFNDFSDGINNKITYTVDDSQRSFEGLKKNDIFKEGFTRVEKGYSEVNQSLQNYKRVLNNYGNDLMSFEKRGMDLVDTINIPKSFSLNDVLLNNNNSQVELFKKDGKSVNEGKESGSVEDVVVGDLVNEENLQDINKDNIDDALVYDESSIIQNKTLGNISNTNVNEEAVYDDASRIHTEALGNINNETSTEEKEYDASSIITNKEQLDEVKDDVILEEKHLDDNYTVLNNMVLEEMNNEEKENKDEVES